MRFVQLVAVLALMPWLSARAGVVINEVFYNAPNDLDDLQWIELHNTGDAAVKLDGWTIDKGQGFEFPAGTSIDAQGYLVVALKPDVFKKSYGGSAVGPLKRRLKRGGEKLELFNAAREVVDVVRYNDKAPWPISADGGSSSLERIVPTAKGDDVANWTASPLPNGVAKPMGSPGKKNASYSAALPPVIKVKEAPRTLAPEQAIHVEALVKDTGKVQDVSLLYRLVKNGAAGPEQTIAMKAEDASGQFRASIPAQPAGTLVRYRVQAVNEAGAVRFYPDANDLRPTMSIYVHDKWPAAKIPLGLIIHGASTGPRNDAPAERRSPRGFFDFGGAPDAVPQRQALGTSAYVHVDPKTGKTELFDHVNIMERRGGRGYKVYLHGDQPLNKMTTLSLIFEGSEGFLVAEAMAYEVYRRAGSPAPLTDFVRLTIDGRPVGFHLMVENPNRAFLRRNKINDDGTLYKIRWYGQGLEGTHEKRTHKQTGHADLRAIVETLNKTRGEEQWKVIQEHFDVEQVATYFAVNMVLSHWDGYFNNYYPYHDSAGTKKWMMFPWDQDKTWGYHDGIDHGDVFFDMPLTFGMTGDRPPPGAGGFGGGFGGGPPWWRPGGVFSGPLLANKQFRQVFLAKTRQILDTVYTQDVLLPVMNEMEERLLEDARLRDRHGGERRLKDEMLRLKTHLAKRRHFLLEQAELKSLAKEPAK